VSSSWDSRRPTTGTLAAPGGDYTRPVTTPIPLRAHQVLCLQGFRGAGYSDAFVARMREVQQALVGNPDRRVELRAQPDVLCAACPNLDPVRGCTLQGLGHEVHMKAHDREVLRRLRLEEGATPAWGEVLERIASNVRGEDLPAICTTCPWLSMGACAQGVDRLREPDLP